MESQDPDADRRREYDDPRMKPPARTDEAGIASEFVDVEPNTPGDHHDPESVSPQQESGGLGDGERALPSDD